MDIEILEQARFSASGNSVLKMMPNKSIPLLDLLVRESIQNSLDAQIPNAKEVKVDIRHGSFDIDSLANYIEKIGSKLRRYTHNQFISIRDSNTIGLIGNLDGNYKKNEKGQNLGSLVFHIMKAQENECAGGSWGIGKTVYYRFGIGMVFYYSRIRLDDGEFQERLVGALVEDEQNDEGLLSDFEFNTGVAFFGKMRGKDVEAIIDAETIHNFLSVFNRKPFIGNETGTEIIIPFINDTDLLDFTTDENGRRYWWQNNVEDYIKTSILRWYFPRMNEKYYYGAKLKAFVNDEIVECDMNVPLFSIYNQLAKVAYSKELSENVNLFKVERNSFLLDNEIGVFVYTKVNAKQLNTKQLPSPFAYLNMFRDEMETSNSPIIAFCRKPGMIVNYDCSGSCTGGVKTDKDTFIIGLFVLNSFNEITSPVNMKLDEYVRGTEKADHASWDPDYMIKGAKRKVLIISNINAQIAKELKRAYGTLDEDTINDEVVNMTFAQRFGKLFLSDTSFTPIKVHKRIGRKRNTSGQTIGNGANKIAFTDITYNQKGLELHYKVSLLDSNRDLLFINCIDTIESSFTGYKYEEDGLKYPCNIEGVAIILERKANTLIDIPEICEFNSNDDSQRFENFDINFLKTQSGKYYGIQFKNLEENPVRLDFSLKIILLTEDKFLKTHFECSIKEGK